MPLSPTPAWLLPTFVRAATGAGSAASTASIERAGRRLLARWEEPRRHFHNVRHLIDLLQHVDELQQETHNPHVVRLAAWYHGAIFSSDEADAYAHRGGEDEDASAEYARLELASLDMPATAIDAVATMVKALSRHTRNPVSSDCAVLCDADLAVLASDPQRYKDYVRDVREEYAYIPEREFLVARKAIVKKLLAREQLYVSPLGATWEQSARQNLAAEASRIDKALAQLVANDGEVSAN
ncbi:HD domain-containing protein [Demequina aurantiaca]|uniref:HD domain-containing protein n=1 Tax=Demequina aurantiaca TaxID=676200 RepID=UPI003D353A3A